MRNLSKTIDWCINQTLPVALIDIDGVVCDNRHRLHYLVEVVDGVQREKEVTDWATYESEWRKDTRGAGCPVVKSLAHVYSIVFLTAREEMSDEDQKELLHTLAEWCGLNRAALIMRERNVAGIQRPPASVFKAEVAEYMQNEGVEIGLFIDDSQDNVIAMAGLSIPSMRLYNHLNETNLHY
ncbi:polynucleotide kinase [Achromobacter phage Motura]|uniref:Polynucleotide kinase n=1 Tax=Achromobacter phage Motura TaxID=2591403 RepID=A0A514CSU7_9CAUD|nr:polynucleotide kinase [Achromobacter phage Motura]QDH83552.1 polynucleotide kinase [Achromobacter phage Motura]